MDGGSESIMIQSETVNRPAIYVPTEESAKVPPILLPARFRPLTGVYQIFSDPKDGGDEAMAIFPEKGASFMAKIPPTDSQSAMCYAGN